MAVSNVIHGIDLEIASRLSGFILIPKRRLMDAEDLRDSATYRLAPLYSPPPLNVEVGIASSSSWGLSGCSM